MSPRQRFAIGALAAVVVVASCQSPINIRHDADPNANFSSYRSYAWISNDPLIGPRPGRVGPANGRLSVPPRPTARPTAGRPRIMRPRDCVRLSPR